MQAQLSYSVPGQLGPWTRRHSSGGWAGWGWQAQEAFTHRAGAWAPLCMASLCPLATLSFPITWWSSDRQTFTQQLESREKHSKQQKQKL